MAGHKPFYFTIQSWMLEEMNLKLAEAAVYGYIHGLTNSADPDRKGWRGSKRRLATVLHTSPSTINDIVNRLEKLGYLHFYADGSIVTTINRDYSKASDKAQTPDNQAVSTNEGLGVQNSDTFSPPEGSDLPF